MTTVFRCILAVLVAFSLFAEAPGALTLEKLFHPLQRVNYSGDSWSSWTWLPDGSLLEIRKDPSGGLPQLLRVNPENGTSEIQCSGATLLQALVTAGATNAEARQALGLASFTWNAAMDAFLVNVGQDTFWVHPSKDAARRLTQDKAEEASFSPDGTKVAYLRGQDLYVVDVATGAETRLTRGGGEDRLNGRLDWIYQEEVFEQDTPKAFWWAPDSQHIAYLSIDLSKVPVHVITDDRTQPQTLLKLRYPKPGDPNPVASLGVVDLFGKTAWMSDPYPGQETLITQVGWDPKGRLIAEYQNRLQTWLELRRFEHDKSRTLIRESGMAWQEHLPLPHYLKKGGFLWTSHRSGFWHLYLCDEEGRVLRAITSGEWDVRNVQGVDETTQRVYASGTLRTVTGMDAFRVDLRGKVANAGLTRLTEPPGTHHVSFNPTFTMALDCWSTALTPERSLLLDGHGKVKKTLGDTATEAFRALRLSPVKFQQVKTRDGFAMETMLVLPPNFDPHRKYPVYQHAYGGPGGFHAMQNSVQNAFHTRNTLWYQFLAQKGYIVWVCDNRSASAKGAQSMFGIRNRLGEQELQDQLDGLAWLKAQGWADMDRVCLSGWSYGGFLTTYAMTHSKAWKLGIAGAPVTDWRLYDSVYTERYMGLPKDNLEGYQNASVLNAAANLHGKLLILHGTLDNNVLPQNTTQLIDALQRSRLGCQLVFLSGANHSPRAVDHSWTRFQATWNFIEKNL